MTRSIWKTIAVALAGAASQQILPALLPMVPAKFAPIVAGAIAVAAAYHLPAPGQTTPPAQTPPVQPTAKSAS